MRGNDGDMGCPQMTVSGMEYLEKRKKENQKGYFFGLVGRGKYADHEDRREEMFGHRSNFIKCQHRWPDGRREWLYHCLECERGIRNKMPRDHRRDCSFYREDELAQWTREGAEENDSTTF